MDKIFVIGDIHGCFDKLRTLMRKIPIDLKQDKLIFIGDYIDRGSQSFKVLEYLINLKKRSPDIIFLKGNHEAMLENYLSGVDRFTYLRNGGQKTLDDYLNQKVHTGSSPVPQDHMAFFKSLVIYHQTEDYIFVHAGLRKKIPLEEQKSEDLLWIRNAFISTDYDFGKRVIFGHTPFQKPLVEKNKIGIDTGAVFGNKLSCVRLPDLKFFSAE
jgi:serine/threonine protein phosphatase 1